MATFSTIEGSSDEILSAHPSPSSKRLAPTVGHHPLVDKSLKIIAIIMNVLIFALLITMMKRLSYKSTTGKSYVHYQTLTHNKQIAALVFVGIYMASILVECLIIYKTYVIGCIICVIIEGVLLMTITIVTATFTFSFVFFVLKIGFLIYIISLNNK